MDIQLRKAEGLNKSKKGRQQAHNKTTHKYERQAVRTAKNKERHIKKAKRLKEAADARKKLNPQLEEGTHEG